MFNQCRTWNWSWIGFRASFECLCVAFPLCLSATCHVRWHYCRPRQWQSGRPIFPGSSPQLTYRLVSSSRRVRHSLGFIYILISVGCGITHPPNPLPIVIYRYKSMAILWPWGVRYETCMLNLCQLGFISCSVPPKRTEEIKNSARRANSVNNQSATYFYGLA